MAVTGEHMSYEGPSGPVRAYLATPEGDGPWPGLIVVQEIVGLEAHIEDMARRFAADGYLAIAPDMYSHDDVFSSLTDEGIVWAAFARGQSDPQAAIEGMPAERREPTRKALSWLMTRDASTYVPDLQAALEFLKSRPDCTGAVGAVGYCMGGGLVGQLTGAGADLNAAVIFYGANPPAEVIPNIKCPMEGHYGTKDFLAPHVPELEANMAANGKEFTAYFYEGAGHAFNNDLRPDWYDAEASRVSSARTTEFFAKHLK